MWSYILSLFSQNDIALNLRDCLKLIKSSYLWSNRMNSNIRISFIGNALVESIRYSLYICSFLNIGRSAVYSIIATECTIVLYLLSTNCACAQVIWSSEYISGLKNKTTSSYIVLPCSSYQVYSGAAVVLDLLSFEPFITIIINFTLGAPTYTLV